MLTFDEATYIYRIDGVIVPSVTQILRPLYDFSAIPRDVLAKAAAFGTAVHTMCLHELAGVLEYGDLDEGLLPCLDAFTNWQADYRDIAARLDGGVWNHEEETIIGDGFRVEKPIGHKRLGYAGRPDIIIDGFMVIDIKSREPNKVTDGIQCEGYEKAHIESGGAKGPYEHRVLYLKRDGTYQFVKVNHRDNSSRFRKLLDYHKDTQLIQSWRSIK